MPFGGQCLLSSGVGARLEWQNAQKNPAKKNTSEIINRTQFHIRGLFGQLLYGGLEMYIPG